MNMRSTRSTVTFSNPFTLPGYPGDLPAGGCEVLVEEELLLCQHLLRPLDSLTVLSHQLLFSARHRRH